MTDEFEYDVFLSHSAKDKEVVRGVAEQLRGDGLRVWPTSYSSEWKIRPGDSIPAKIEAGLENSRVFVLCMSAHAFGSDWAQLEAGTFRFRDLLNQQRRFIPLRLDDAPIKGSLMQFLPSTGSRMTTSRACESRRTGTAARRRSRPRRKQTARGRPEDPRPLAAHCAGGLMETAFPPAGC